MAKQSTISSNASLLLHANWRQCFYWIAAALISFFIVTYPSAAVALLGEKYATQRVAQMALLLMVGILTLLWCIHNLVEVARAYLEQQRQQHGKTFPPIAPNAISRNRTLLNILPLDSDWLLIAIAILGFISSLLAAHIEFALLEWSYTVLLVSLAYAVSHWLQTNQTKHWQQLLAITVLASLGIYFVLTIVYWIASLSNSYRYSTEVLFDIGFENMRFAAGYQILLLPLLFWLSQIDDGWIRRYRFVIYTLSGFCLMLCAVTQSRGTVLFIGGATILVAYINLRALKTWMRFLFISSIVGVALGLAMFWLPPRFGWILDIPGLRTSLANATTLSMRDEIWLIAISHIYSSPIWGIGPMHFAAFDNLGHGAHPHNIYLQIWAEWGSISFVLWLCVLFIALRKFINHTKFIFTGLDSNNATNNKLPSQNHYLISVVLAAAYGGILFFGLVDGLFVYPVTQVIIAMLVGLGIGITRLVSANFAAANKVNINTEFEPVSANKKPSFWCYPLKILCVMTLMFTSTVSVIKIVPLQIPDTLFNEDNYAESGLAYPLTPRFWRQGWFNYETAPRRKIEHEAKHKPKP